MKTSALRIRVEPQLHDDFLYICKSLDQPASQVIRQFMRGFVDENSERPQEDLFENIKFNGKKTK